VLAGLQSGFDVGIHGMLNHMVIYCNHASSSIDCDFVSSYIAGEVEADQYSKGFKPEMLEKRIRPFHTSPIGLHPKPHS
jgi:hypothetical protein